MVAKGYVDPVILLPAVLADVDSMQACWAPQASHRVLACVVQVAGVGAHGQVCAFPLLDSRPIIFVSPAPRDTDVSHSPHVQHVSSAITWVLDLRAGMQDTAVNSIWLWEDV